MHPETPRLPQHWAEFLHKLPETGMDYQTVSVTLQDGRRFDDVAIVHSNYIGEVRGHDGVPFQPDEIADIRLTHNKWVFQR